MPTPVPPRHRQPLQVTAGATVAEFTWQGDRWQHHVTTLTGRWSSVEGSSRDARWPDSPVLVELSLVPVADGQALLGVGLAGRSHFSLSVRPCPRTADTVLFEAACRIHEPAEWLGSTYHGPAGELARIAAVGGPAPATVNWAYSIGPAGVRPTSPARPA